MTRSNRDWWRTIDELMDSPGFLARLQRTLPSQVHSPIHGHVGAVLDQLSDPVSRRAFLKLMGASLALAGVTGCTRQPPEKIVPYVRQPEGLVPGKPLLFATAMPLSGAATGLLVESHEGRPTKIEGNPQHPGSLGATDVFAQAAVLGLYDPDRSQTITNLGDIRPWSEFLGAMRSAVTAQQPRQGSGLRLLTESVISPTLAWQIRGLLARFPAARWHRWDPLCADHARAGARLAFGTNVDARYRLDNADVMVSLDADVLGCGPGGLRYARDFAARRRPELGDHMNRLYVVESMPGSTGARADHRFAVRPGDIPGIARALAAAMGIGEAVSAPGIAPSTIAAIARDLLRHRGSSLVMAGDAQPPLVHALAHAMNEALGNVGRTVVYTEPVEADPVDHLQSLHDLVADMRARTVDALIIIGGNPVYTAPADFGFADALGSVPLRAHLSLYDDETSALCHWQIPEAHFLESWSDARAYDGTVSIVQPLIAPLYGGKSAHELLAAMSDRPERTSYEIVREYWMNARGRGAAPGSAFEAEWRRWLHDGVVPDTSFPPQSVSIRRDAIVQAAKAAGGAATSEALPALEIAFRHDPSVLDGRFANNGWLQELPKPITRLAWDNAVLVSPATAARLKATDSPSPEGGEHGQIIGDVVEIRYRGRTVRGALFSVVGHPDGCVTVHLGYGRTRAGHVGTGAGFNAYALRTSDALWSGGPAEIVRTGDTHPLACTQYHHLMEGRGMVRAATREEVARNPSIFQEGGSDAPPSGTLYPAYRYEGHKWGMAIDVNACIGCNACIIGCQAENNIPVVGKEQVLRGREMHWLRIDTYYRGPLENPETYFQPVPCMQCENAPCEVVCPVGATVHSAEGLNDMVYNRCVGTRYCSNNCPYKVRRFNFLLYQDWNTPSLRLGRNPDVTVRSRGVMEKCTYCVQRINEAKIDAENGDRPVRDGDIRTACQQVCPADAIVFGDLNDPASRVARLQAEARNYSLLAELNTRPRTTYLGAVRNPNPEVGG